MPRESRQRADDTMSRTAYFWDPLNLEHDTGAHVEVIERAVRLRPERMTARVPGIDLPMIEPHDAAAWVQKLHTQRYHDWVRQTSEHGPACLDGGDTVVSRCSYDAALCAVDAALTAADLIMAGAHESAFCAMRPPGHHALPDEAMGFCLFSTIAITARYLQQHHGLRRIAIIDFDVHHGNGTQHFFYDDPDVFFVSMHQHPLWPGSGLPGERGKGTGQGATLNVQVAPMTPQADYLDAFQRTVLPAVSAHAPEFVLVSAGFDAHEADPLANLMLNEEGFARLGTWIRELAAAHAQGRVLSVLEGGYNLDALEASVAAYVDVLNRE